MLGKDKRKSKVEDANWLGALGILLVTIVTILFLPVYDFFASVRDWLKGKKEN